MIRVQNLVKRFGQTLAVDDISFAVERGEVVGFLGPNGAGKTTTIRVLACYHSATTGSAQVAGHDVFADPVAVRRQVGYLPENVPIYPDLRVEEYLRYRAALKGVARRDRGKAVEWAMERCGVLEVRRKLVGNVSRGYRQRVGLADALVARPPILILDEPTSGLDPNQRRRMKGLIRELAEEHTILFSSHILAEVSEVSGRILIIDRGKIRADGSLDELLESSRGRQMVVVARMEAEPLRTGLLALDGVEEVQLEAREDGMQEARSTLAADADPREAAFRWLARSGAEARELRLDLPTLEEVFRQVTTGTEVAAE